MKFEALSSIILEKKKKKKSFLRCLPLDWCLKKDPLKNKLMVVLFQQLSLEKATKLLMKLPLPRNLVCSPFFSPPPPWIQDKLLRKRTTRREEEKKVNLPNQIDLEVITKVSGPEVGYVTTPICVCESAYVLLEMKKTGKIPCGVLSPAAAFAKTNLIERLHQNGVQFTVVSRKDL